MRGFLQSNDKLQQRRAGRSTFDGRNAVKMWRWKAYLGWPIVLYYDARGLPHRSLN